jgi:LPXTG-motif cell wall-anchored protein
MRSQTETFRFTATYPNSVQARTGSATIRIVEADGLTEHDVTATYRTNIGQFEGNYQIPLSSQIGAWVASIDIGGYNDGYGNIGPSASVNRGFAVSAAILIVTPSTPNGNYTTGSIIVINAKVVTPDGTDFTSGTVTATTHHSALQIGNPLQLSYDQTHGKWVGSYTVNSTSPAGIWFIQVNATDAYGNSGYGSTSTLVTIPPTQQPPPQTSTFNYLWILVIGLVAALAVLASFVVYRRGRMVRKVLKVDLEAIHAEAKKVENNEFFKNVQEQLKEQRKNPPGSTDAK